MKQLLALALFVLFSGSGIAQETVNDSIPQKEPLLKAGFSIGLSETNFILSKNPDLSTIVVQNTIFRDTATFKSISTKPGIFLNLGFFVSTKISDKLELRINPLLRFNNANLFYEFTNGQATVENKQAIDFTHVEIPLQLNYLIGNEINKTFVHSIGIGYNFVFYINKPNKRMERDISLPGGTTATIYDGVVFENYFMNIEANINLRLSKKPKAQLLTFRTSYSFTNLLADDVKNNPYNTAITRMSLLSFGLLFQIR